MIAEMYAAKESAASFGSAGAPSRAVWRRLYCRRGKVEFDAAKFRRAAGAAVRALKSRLPAACDNPWARSAQRAGRAVTEAILRL